MPDTAEIIAFDSAFDGSHMTIEEVRQEARNRGWAGIQIDVPEFNATGVLMVRRLSSAHVARGIDPVPMESL